jgi:hypothetical protein
MPKFMENPKWYIEEYNEEEGYTVYKPTKDTPQDAIEEMDDWNRYNENGGDVVYPNDKDFYFKKNPAWFTFDNKEKMYVLTREATSEAKESYLEYVSQAKLVEY